MNVSHVYCQSSFCIQEETHNLVGPNITFYQTGRTEGELQPTAVRWDTKALSDATAALALTTKHPLC